MCLAVGVDSGAVLAGELKELLEVMLYPYANLSSVTLSSIHINRITGEVMNVNFSVVL